MSNFYVGFYETFRVELVRFASQFDHGEAGAEDLFEDCHMALCHGYTDLSEVEYIKLMKTAIKNRYKDEFRKDKFEIDPQLLIPSDLSIEERVFRKEEMEILMLSLNGLREEEREILLVSRSYQSLADRVRKNRLKQKLLKQSIEAIPSPVCPQCGSKLLLFDMDDLAWTCDSCGFETNQPILVKRGS